MTGVDDLHEPLVAALSDELGDLLRQAAAPDVAPQDLLEAAVALGRQVTRTVYQAATTLAAEREPAPNCPGCKRAMVRHQRLGRTLCHLGGDLHGCFQRWRCRHCGEGACPGYDRLVRYGCTPAALELAVSTCTLLPFEVAERHLARVGLHLSDNTLQRLTGDLGGQRAAARDSEAEAVLDLRCNLTPATAPERLYLQADGYKVQVGRQWREVRLGVVYEAACVPADQRLRPDGEPGPKTAPERVSVVAGLTDCDTFAGWLTAEAQRRGIERVAEVVLIADGAPWIWDRLRGLVPPWVKVVEVLDWYHLVENLARAVKAAYGEPGNRWWLERLKEVAWAGDTNELLRLLASLRERAPNDEAAHTAACVLAYVREHRHRMDYQRLDFEGYHVGSGVVESRCKQFGQRTKGPGMNWSEPGVNAVLALLADELTAPAVARSVAV